MPSEVHISKGGQCSRMVSLELFPDSKLLGKKRKMGFKSIAVVVFIGIVSYHVYHVIKFLRYDEVVFNHEPGPCRVVGLKDPECKNALGNDPDCDMWAERGECTANEEWMTDNCGRSCGQCEDPNNPLLGSEDFAHLGGGKVLISSGLQFKHRPFPDRQGNIYLFDMNKPNAGGQLVDMIWDEPEAKLFNPHGISIFRSKSGKVTLFVVNHPGTESVEKFEYNEKDVTLTHLETIRSDSFTYLNAVAPVSESSFYVSNFQRRESGLMSHIEIYLMLRFGNVVFFNGDNNNSGVVADGMFITNGITLTPDSKYLHVSHLGEATIETFKVLEDYTLEHVQTTNAHCPIDNIKIDQESGNMWLGCVPSIAKSAHYLDDPENTSAPSVALWMETKEGLPTGNIKDVYSNDGQQISHATVAFGHRDKLIVGSVYDRMVFCEIRHM